MKWNVFIGITLLVDKLEFGGEMPSPGGKVPP